MTTIGIRKTCSSHEHHIQLFSKTAIYIYFILVYMFNSRSGFFSNRTGNLSQRYCCA